MCTKPLIRAETYENYINKQGGKSYKVEWLPRDIWDRDPKMEHQNKTWANRYRRVQPIPCGQCIECKLNYSRNWATRIMLEMSTGYPQEDNWRDLISPTYGAYPDGSCWFVTLTYRDEELHFSKYLNTETGEIHEGATLAKEDVQKFIKRLRKAFNGRTRLIKYYHCGEYGKQTQRPHYHLILFGVPLDQTKFRKIGMSKDNTPRWTTPELEKIWGLGNIDIGRVTWESAAYTARYTLKKAMGVNIEWYQAQGQHEEYVTMSQGIGQAYFTKNWKTMYDTDTVPVINKKTGQLVKPPQRFDRMLKELDEELYEEIKRKRMNHQYSNEIELRYQSDLSPEQRRTQSEERMKRVLKDMRGDM